MLQQLLCFTDIDFSATVPGGIYTDLVKNNIIENNLCGRNDVNNRWVGNQSVIYTKTFNGKLIKLEHEYLRHNIKRNNLKLRMESKSKSKNGF